MADALTEYLKRFINLGENVFKIVFDNEETKAEIIRLNTQEQLFEEGVDSNGQRIEPAYAPLTVDIKRLEGLPSDRVTLFQSGEFYESFTVTVGANFFTIDANDVKEDTRLFEKYGEDVLGLTDESFNDLLVLIQDIVYEELQKIQ